MSIALAQSGNGVTTDAITALPVTNAGSQMDEGDFTITYLIEFDSTLSQTATNRHGGSFDYGTSANQYTAHLRCRTDASTAMALGIRWRDSGGNVANIALDISGNPPADGDLVAVQGRYDYSADSVEVSVYNVTQGVDYGTGTDTLAAKLTAATSFSFAGSTASTGTNFGVTYHAVFVHNELISESTFDAWAAAPDIEQPVHQWGSSGEDNLLWTTAWQMIENPDDTDHTSAGSSLAGQSVASNTICVRDVGNASVGTSYLAVRSETTVSGSATHIAQHASIADGAQANAQNWSTASGSPSVPDAAPRLRQMARQSYFETIRCGLISNSRMARATIGEGETQVESLFGGMCLELGTDIIGFDNLSPADTAANNRQIQHTNSGTDAPVNTTTNMQNTDAGRLWFLNDATPNEGSRAVKIANTNAYRLLFAHDADPGDSNFTSTSDELQVWAHIARHPRSSPVTPQGCYADAQDNATETGTHTAQSSQLGPTTAKYTTPSGYSYASGVITLTGESANSNGIAAGDWVVTANNDFIGRVASVAANGSDLDLTLAYTPIGTPSGTLAVGPLTFGKAQEHLDNSPNTGSSDDYKGLELTAGTGDGAIVTAFGFHVDEFPGNGVILSPLGKSGTSYYNVFEGGEAVDREAFKLQLAALDLNLVVVWPANNSGYSANEQGALQDMLDDIQEALPLADIVLVSDVGHGDADSMEIPISDAQWSAWMATEAATRGIPFIRMFGKMLPVDQLRRGMANSMAHYCDTTCQEIVSRFLTEAQSNATYTRTILRFAGGIVTGSGGTLYSQGDILAEYSVLEGEDVDFEAIAGYKNGIESVVFSLTDGTTTVTKTASDWSLSTYTNSQAPYGPSGVYKGSFTGAEIATLNDGEVTLTITATATNGRGRSVSHTFLNNAGDTRSIVTVYADSVGGDDTTGDGTSGSPYASLEKALEQAATSAAAGISDPEDVIPLVYLEEGTYALAQVGSPYAANLTWATVAAAPGAAKANIDVHNYTATAGIGHRVRLLRFKGITIDRASAAGASGVIGHVLAVGHATLYTVANGLPDTMWFDDCTITHHLGRTGQGAVSAQVLINDSNFAAIPWFTRCHFDDMYNDGLSLEAYVRDCKFSTLTGDVINDMVLAMDIWAEDTKILEDRIAVSTITGATETTGYVRGTTSGAYARIINKYESGGNQDSLRIDTNDAVFADFDADENVSNGLTYHANEADAISGANSTGTATHNPVHPDTFQLDQDNLDRNAVVYNCAGGDLDGQQIFMEKSQANILVANCSFWSNSLAFISQIGNATAGTYFAEHILHWNNFLPNQAFYARPESVVTYRDCEYAHCIALDFYGDIPSTDGTANGITIFECHATDPTATYTTSRGAISFANVPDYDETSVTGATDFSPSAGTDTAVGVPYISAGQVRIPYDADGNLRADDGSDLIGAFLFAGSGGGNTAVGVSAGSRIFFLLSKR